MFCLFLIRMHRGYMFWPFHVCVCVENLECWNFLQFTLIWPTLPRSCNVARTKIIKHVGTSSHTHTHTHALTHTQINTNICIQGENTLERRSSLFYTYAITSLVHCTQLVTWRELPQSTNGKFWFVLFFVSKCKYNFLLLLFISNQPPVTSPFLPCVVSDHLPHVHITECVSSPISLIVSPSLPCLQSSPFAPLSLRSSPLLPHVFDLLAHVSDRLFQRWFLCAI